MHNTQSRIAMSPCDAPCASPADVASSRCASAVCIAALNRPRTSSPNFHGSSSAGSTACCSLPCEAGAENRRAGADERAAATAAGRILDAAAAGCADRATADAFAATGAAAREMWRTARPSMTERGRRTGWEQRAESRAQRRRTSSERGDRWVRWWQQRCRRQQRVEHTQREHNPRTRDTTIC